MSARLARRNMTNPFCYVGTNGEPLLELKTGLVLYLENAPSPWEAGRVYQLYMRHCGERVRNYCSTAPGSIPKPWNSKALHRFEDDELPDLRMRQHWGYAFDDGNLVDSWLFMFHGYRPHREAGKASFYRFDFPWDVDLSFFRRFAVDLISLVPCVSGFGGYYFQADVTDLNSSYDLMFALAHRFWGIDAHNLDRTVQYMLEGIKSVNWLTIIGRKYTAQFPGVIAAAKEAAFYQLETDHATIFQAQEAPAFGDVNRQQLLLGYQAVAMALLPIQIPEHQALGGTKWTDENTSMYIHRFTDGSYSSRGKVGLPY